jgi:hypothetical protein
VHRESRVAVTVEWDQFENPEKGTSAVGNRYQRAGKGYLTKRYQCVCADCNFELARAPHTL